MREIKNFIYNRMKDIMEFGYRNCIVQIYKEISRYLGNDIVLQSFNDEEDMFYRYEKMVFVFAMEDMFYDLLDWMIKNGADVNMKGLFDIPLWYRAIYLDDIKLVRYFITKGVCVNEICGVDKLSPAQFAASLAVLRKNLKKYKESENMISLLKKKYEQFIKMSIEDTETIILDIDKFFEDCFKIDSDLEILSLLITNSENEILQTSDINGNHLLDYIVALGDIDNLKLAQKKGLDFNCTDQFGCNLLYKIDYHNDYNDILDFLVDVGVSLNKKNYAGNNILLLAFLLKDERLIDKFISLGVDIENVNNFNMNILQELIELSEFSKEINSLEDYDIDKSAFIDEMVSELKNLELSINIRDYKGYVEILLNYVKYIEINDLEKVIKRSCDKHIRFRNLVNRVDGGSPTYFYLFKNSDIRLLKYLIYKKFIDFNLIDDYGNNILHNAIIFESVEVISKLLETYHSYSIINNRGQNILHQAILTKNKRIFDIIFEKFQKFNNCDVDGLTPLHYAINTNNVHAFNSIMKMEPDLTILTKSGLDYYNFAIAEECDYIIITFLQKYFEKHERLNSDSEIIDTSNSSMKYNIKTFIFKTYINIEHYIFKKAHIKYELPKQYKFTYDLPDNFPKYFMLDKCKIVIENKANQNIDYVVLFNEKDTIDFCSIVLANNIQFSGTIINEILRGKDKSHSLVENESEEDLCKSLIHYENDEKKVLKDLMYIYFFECKDEIEKVIKNNYICVSNIDGFKIYRKGRECVVIEGEKNLDSKYLLKEFEVERELSRLRLITKYADINARQLTKKEILRCRKVEKCLSIVERHVTEIDTYISIPKDDLVYERSESDCEKLYLKINDIRSIIKSKKITISSVIGLLLQGAGAI